MEEETKRKLIGLLSEIEAGIGPFNREQLAFAEGVIEANKERAKEAREIIEAITPQELI